MNTLFLLIWFTTQEAPSGCKGASTFSSFDACTLRVEQYFFYDAATERAKKVLFADKNYYTAFIHNVATGKNTTIRRQDVRGFRFEIAEVK